MFSVKEVFISYHGGRGDEERSSYAKAEALHEYLESRGVSCFLCKRIYKDDFYDAIDHAIRTCSHFVLVAQDKEMLSEWVRDEIKQFDALRKNGEKPFCYISAYIYGSIAEADLYQFNSLFSTKDIAKGELGFAAIYDGISAKNNERKGGCVQSVFSEEKTFHDVSRSFLPPRLRDDILTDSLFAEECHQLTRRIQTANPYLLPRGCEDVVAYIYGRAVAANDKNVFKITGKTGTQKSFVLQLLYLYFLRHCDQHCYTPVYLHFGVVKKQLRTEGGDAKRYFARLFEQVQTEVERVPLFLIDGVLNVVADEFGLDYALRDFIDERFPSARILLSVTDIFADNMQRQNKSAFVHGRFADNIMHFNRISIYERENCIKYLSTFEKYDPADLETLYEDIYRSGVLFLNEHIADIFYQVPYRQNIMDAFETSLLNRFGGSYELLAEAAEDAFSFAYGSGALRFSKKSLSCAFELIEQESAYLDCLIALYWLYQLEQYREGDDFDFFQMVMPKEITRFISARVRKNPKYESAILLLGKQYNKMAPLGKSEMSFFLGRISHSNYTYEAVELLEKYYEETKAEIACKQGPARGTPYSMTEYKQDLFLLRGISVSLIYCEKREVLYEYLHSLLENDLCNSINRGFHLEYYGDKRYLPNQDSLDYEDDPRVGQRTLRLLCDSVEKKMQQSEPPVSLLLDLFTVVSLLQCRMETRRREISFNITPFVTQAIKLLLTYLDMFPITDNILDGFFKMALADLEQYRETEAQLDVKLDVCSDYLSAKNIKRTGWVTQGIPAPESITEHMYSCWFLALVNLPSEDRHIRGYDKQRILDMLLIHDLAETKLQDIPKYEKKNFPGYDATENEAMLAIFLKGTYAAVDSMSRYAQAWNEWYLRRTENAKIAKDIDTIQAIYQFLEYYECFPNLFDEARVLNWLREINEVRTRHGREILERMVVGNPRFATIFERYNDQLM